LNIPSGVPSILSIQINNAGTHQPLAIGATKIDLASASPVTDMVVEMGSVTRNCYYVNDALSYAYYTYGFKNDTLANSLTTGPSYDLQVEYQGLTSGAYVFYLADASGNTPTPNSIAYMGTGKLVDYDKVPADSQFGAASTLTKTAAMGVTTTSFVESGDIYCIKLNTISGGHAWIQIVNPGSFPTCSTFIFRTNSSLPYYGYEQTAADVTSTCSGTW
jgi:hypothetical protein